MIRIFGAPKRYIQGPEAIRLVGTEAKSLGQRALVIIDAGMATTLGPVVDQCLTDAGVEKQFLHFASDVTWNSVNALEHQARSFRPDLVVAVGGGKTIDASKAIARATESQLITAPTIASNDSPTSSIFVIYGEDHSLLSVEQLASNPAVVIVDTSIICRAPARFFSAGIGDAISKRFEVEQCQKAGGKNIFGTRSLMIPLVLAQHAFEVLRSKGQTAMTAVKSGSVNEALEDVVEATVLLSGLAFENGGLSIAHAMTRGLSAARGTRLALHGHAVAYALLVQLKLEGWTNEQLAEMRVFYETVEMPSSLAALGMTAPRPSEIQEIAVRTIDAPHTRNFSQALEVQDLVAAMSDIEAMA